MSLLPNATFASPGNPLYEGVPTSNWYLYPTLTGTVKFIDDTGEHLLQSIDGDLFFDGELLAKAGDIQNIADWSLYPALATVMMENKDIFGAGAITGASMELTGDLKCADIECVEIIATGDITTAVQVNCAHINIFETGTMLGDVPATTTEIFEGIITNGSDIINQGDISTNTLHVTTSANVGSLEATGDISGATLHVATSANVGSLEATGDISGATLHVATSANVGSLEATGDISGATVHLTGNAEVQSLNLLDGTAPCALTTNAGGTTLFINGSPVQTGTPADASLWATFPAVQTVDISGFDINNIGSITAGGITESIAFGGALTPMLQNNQYALTTTIQTTSPLNTMTLQSAGGMNISAGAGEFNITSLVGDMNFTAPDINMTMTDPTSFMNFTAPGGITIAGGGLFMASGVMECLIPGDITLVSAGNVSIGSGNVLGADTEIEKFTFNDNEMSVKSGIQFLRLHNIRSIDNEIPSGVGGDGKFDLACLASATTTVTKASDGNTTTTTTDANNRLFSIVNNTDPVTLALGTNANVFTTTFYGASSVVYATTGGTLNMSGITDISTNTVHTGTVTTTGDISGGGSIFANLTSSAEAEVVCFNTTTKKMSYTAFPTPTPGPPGPPGPAVTLASGLIQVNTVTWTLDPVTTFYYGQIDGLTGVTGGSRIVATYQLTQAYTSTDTSFAKFCAIICTIPYSALGGGLRFFLEANPTGCSNNVLISWAVTG